MEESTTESVNASTLNRAQLLEAVRKQVEYYFSKENLQSDVYLTSQMDAQMTVPISVVMKFAKLKALTQDESVIREALVESTITSVVDNRIKATVKPAGRSTIILREIPSDAPEEEVRAIFNYEGCKPIGAIRSDIGDSWFVSMDSEEDAKDTLLDLRLKKRTFRGQSVKARMKNETVIRSYYPLPGAPVIPTGYPAYPVGAMPLDLRSFGYALPQGPVEGVLVDATGAPVIPDVKASGEEVKNTNTGSNSNNTNNKSNNSGNKDNRGADNAKKGVAQSGNKSAPSNTNANNNNNNKKSDGNNARNSKGASGNRKEHDAAASRPHIEINSANFPPLSSDDSPVPTPGYKDAYVKYSFEEIITIVKEVKEATLPASLNPSMHPFALTTTPNLDLLKKQRSYSIDETREQLRQGRPVHREAITAGAVDIHSLIYGDEGQTQQQPAAPVAAAAQPAVEASAAPSATPSKSSGTRSRGGSHDHTYSQTPKKISAASWAAMVKSSAAATEGATAPSSALKSTPEVRKAAASATPSKDAKTASTSGEKKKSASGAAGSSSTGKDSGKANASAGGDKEGRRDRKKGGGAAKDATASAADDNKASDDAAGASEGAAPAVAVSEGDAGASSAGETSPAAGGAWGGKASFANIVKLKSTEEGDAATSPAKPEKPAAAPVARSSTAPSSGGKSGGGRDSNRPSTSGSKPSGERSSNKDSKDEAGHGRRNRGHGGSSGEERKERDRDGGNRTKSSSSSGANASGVWAKATLPALKN